MILRWLAFLLQHLIPLPFSSRRRAIAYTQRIFCTFITGFSFKHMVYITKSFQGILNFGAKRDIFEYARELRKNETEAEKVLWRELRSRRCSGLKFRRQHPAKEFVLDFYCHEYLLGIEVDGTVHENEAAKEYDQNRTAELENLGITLLRFKNEEVLSNLSKVLNEIRNKIVQLKNMSRQ
jgi:very-short-patch-repair endonuclease